MKIFLTWDSSWIWKAILEQLNGKYNVFWVSRTGQYKFDLTKKEDIFILVEKFKDIKFDILIFNAWIGYFGDFRTGNIEIYEKIIKLNLLSNIMLLKLLNFDKRSKIIFIWSIIWKKFMRWAAVYQASKFWLRGLAWALKKEWHKVYIINPKIVSTKFHPYDLDLSFYHKTEIKDIVKTVENIISGIEKRFEIDL